ncbi:glycosyltransferase family 39 protein [Kineococcus sp. SYSU DK003]|uniref:glycosyltransferase family 39 protein n=1 Tax=Kineococcus sp. SYSU DK003 TaxID=3383124 RepID=UPI003D7F0F2C
MAVRSTHAVRAVVLTGLLLLAVFAFGWRLGRATSTGDELVYRGAAAAYLRGDFSLNQEHPPLAKWLIALGHSLGDGSLVDDRAPAAVCGVLTAAVLFAVARRCGGFWTGAVAAGLWCALPLAPGVVPFHLDRRATLEAPLLLFTALAVLAAQRVAEAPRRDGRWVLLGVAVGAATASKLTGAVVAVVALAVLFPLRRSLTGVVLAAVSALLVFVATYLPFGPVLPDALRYVVEFQLQHADDGAVQSVAGTLYRFPPWWSAWWFQSRYLGWLGVALLWGLAVLGATRWSRPAVRPVVVALAGFTVAVVASPLKLPQYHDVLVPPLVVLAAVGLTQLARWWLPGRIVAAAAAVALLVVAVPHLAALARTGPDGYTRVAALLADRPGTVVVWGDVPAFAASLPNRVVGTTVPDCSAVALVVDPTVADRMPDADVAAWAACDLAPPVEVDRFTVRLQNAAPRVAATGGAG